MRPDGTPFGVTLLAPAGHDAMLASIGRVFHADTGLPLGALGRAQPPLAPLPPVPAAGEIALAVVGAHLSGMPLNGELQGARRAASRRRRRPRPTTGCTRSPARTPPKPGLLRVAAGQGAAIALEIWALPAEGFGRFVAAVPPPLSIGTLAGSAIGRER